MTKPNCKCYICKKPIYKIPSRETDHPLCSYACRNKYFRDTRSFVWKGGEKGRQKWLKSYQGREHDRERKKAHKLKAIELLGSKCVACGYGAFSCALEFHHINPLSKDMSIKQLAEASWKRMEKEVKKCVLLCSNCHKVVHYKLHRGCSSTKKAIKELKKHRSSSKDSTTYRSRNTNRVIIGKQGGHNSERRIR